MGSFDLSASFYNTSTYLQSGLSELISFILQPKNGIFNIFTTIPPSHQSSVSPSANILTATSHAGQEYVLGNSRDLYTDGLSECNVIATWTSAGINTLMHVTGQGVTQCVNNLVSHINNTPGIIYVIAVAGPDNGTEHFFVNNWYSSLIQDPLVARLSAANRARVSWVAPDPRLLRNVGSAPRGTFALPVDGKYGPSYDPARPASSSSSLSGSSFGNKGPLASARPSQSPARGGSSARPSNAGSAGSGKGAPTAGGKTASPTKMIAATPVDKR